MKQEVIRLVGESQKRYMFKRADEMPLDSSVEVVFRNAQVGKSQAQLGALFGLWMGEITEQTGEDKDSIHKRTKPMFLPAIYIANQMGPFHREQKNWVDLLAALQELGDMKKFDEHVESVRMGWASWEQQRDFMNQFYAYFTNNGIALSIPDKYYKALRPEIQGAA